jgi:hypothetical protein
MRSGKERMCEYGSKDSRGGTFKGVVLPPGMTAALAARLESLVCEYVDAANGEADHVPIKLPFEFGIAVFQEIAKTRR